MVMVLGVGSGAVALVGVRRRGPEQLVVPAVIGLGVSAVVTIVWLMVTARAAH